jgi:hypothetical protein
MTFNQLRTFIEVARAGSVVEARLQSGEFWPGAHTGLTQRESEVLGLMVRGQDPVDRPLTEVRELPEVPEVRHRLLGLGVFDGGAPAGLDEVRDLLAEPLGRHRRQVGESLHMAGGGPVGLNVHVSLSVRGPFRR